uniref:Carboxypeptidase n=1 Tax=Aureoumbra lagunensis TaxID=44058 RepID=A0A7S3JYM7_9STRA
MKKFCWLFVFVPWVIKARRVVLWEEYSNNSLVDEERRLDVRKRPSVALPASPLSKDEHLVASLPGLHSWQGGAHWAGMLESEDGGRIFYWFFEMEKKSQDAPWLIWLNGGPGCTSMDGLFLENGPFHAPKKNGDIELRQSSWHKFAHVLYIDQPIGTGFSWSRNNNFCRNDNCIGHHFKQFLRRFAYLHSELVLLKNQKKSIPLFFSGESHAGHYVPLFVHELWQDEIYEWDIRGIALGNAWIEPRYQYDVSRHAFALGLINAQEFQKLKIAETTCQTALDHKQYLSKACWNLLDDALRATAQNNKHHLKANMYDSRDSVRSTAFFPPGHEAVEKWMNLPTIRAALHIDAQAPRFQECANPPYNALKHQDGLGVATALSAILDNKRPSKQQNNRPIRTLFYNGQYDLICNHAGVHRSLGLLPWRGAATFIQKNYKPWRRANGAPPAGYLLETGTLALVLVADAGHMVPMNQPEVAFDMISRFISFALGSYNTLADSFNYNASPKNKFSPEHICIDRCGSLRNLPLVAKKFKRSSGTSSQSYFNATLAFR